MVVASIQVEWCSVRLSRNTSGYEITQINYFYLSPFFTLLSYFMKKLKWDFVTRYRWRLRKRIGQLDNWRTSRNGYVWVNEMIVRYNSMHYYTFFFFTSFDIRRYCPKVSADAQWVKERSHEAYAKNYSMVFPHDEPLAGRNMKKVFLWPLNNEIVLLNPFSLGSLARGARESRMCLSGKSFNEIVRLAVKSLF